MLRPDTIVFRSSNRIHHMPTAGVGYQITPQITIEGSVGITQMQGSNFR